MENTRNIVVGLGVGVAVGVGVGVGVGVSGAVKIAHQRITGISILEKAV